MEKCDTCLLYEFDKGWCRQNKHCRVSGHQYTPTTIESKQQLTKGDQSSYTLFSNCPKCPRPPQTQPYSSSYYHAPPVSQPFGNQPPLTHTSHGQPNQLYDPYKHPPSQPQHQRPPPRSPSSNADTRYQQPRWQLKAENPPIASSVPSQTIAGQEAINLTRQHTTISSVIVASFDPPNTSELNEQQKEGAKTFFEKDKKVWLWMIVILIHVP